MAAATPKPTSHLPSRTVPGRCRRRSHLKRRAPSRRQFDDAPLRVRYILLRIDCGLVPDAKVDRIHVEGMREFVHRRLKRQQAGCFAWSTHVLAAQHV